MVQGPLPIPITIHPDRAHLVSQFLLSLNAKEGSHPIAHLHGYHDHPSSIILAADDYEEAYGLRGQAAADPLSTSPSWPLHRRLVWALLATRRLVFIGFSLDDVDFQVLLKSVANDLWNWGQSIHFALMGIGPNNPEAVKGRAEELVGRYGVRVVFYEDFDGSPAGLDQFISDSLLFCQAANEDGYLEALNRRTRHAMGYED